MSHSPVKPHWSGLGQFPVKIAGTHFYRDNIARIAKNTAGSNALVFCTALLSPELNNAHDPNAVLIQINSEPVGHLSRDHASHFRDRLTAAGLSWVVTSCDAVISGGIETPDTSYNYIIELDLDLAGEPTQCTPKYQTIDRRETGKLEHQGDQRYLVEVWLEAGVLGDMHKKQGIDTWTTARWDTVNYYVANRQNCGTGPKLFSVPKDQHENLFGSTSPIASFQSIDGRRAVIELVAGV